MLKDARGIGRANEIVETADGFALNYLIPKKLAVVATTGAANTASARKAHVDERRALEAKLVQQNLATLAEARVVVQAKANEKGHLYDAVGEKEIAAAVKEQVNIELPHGAIGIEKPFKEVGEFTVPVSAGDSFGEFTLIVEAA